MSDSQEFKYALYTDPIPVQVSHEKKTCQITPQRAVFLATSDVVT